MRLFTCGILFLLVLNRHDGVVAEYCFSTVGEGEINRLEARNTPVGYPRQGQDGAMKRSGWR